MDCLPVLFHAILFLSLISTLPRSACDSGDESFVFSGFAGAGNLTLADAAKVTTEGLLQLTNNTETIKGHAFYPTPLRFKEFPNATTTRSFSAAFVFAIVAAYGDEAGSTDGMAFLVAPTTDFSDATAAQYMGFLNGAAMDATFAVELDTYRNAELRDIDGNHAGVHVGGGLFSVDSHAAAFHDDRHGDGALTGLSLDSGEPMQVWVDYDGQSKRVDVTLAPMGVAKPSTPLISNVSDLSSVLTERAYVGFSAATGPIKTRHYVLAWSFAVDGPAPPIDFGKMPKLPRSPSRSSSLPRTTLKIVALSVAASAFAMATCVAATLLLRRRLAYAEVREDWEVEFGPHRFSYRDLFHAAEGFKSSNLLGAGGFGKVYKGVLPKSRSEVAVKRVSHESSQGVKEFISEVVSIGHLRHRNLVQLLGYCRRKGELLLVYEYMPNGSLDKYLYGTEEDDDNNKPVLGWAHRFQIIKDVASAVFYLHEKWDQVVVHRDIKASNVLLDGEMNAHLGDFGLARLHDHGAHLQTTHVVGTMGYIAPELARTGRASPLTDVFAFGVFLLEVACGRQPVSNSVRHGRKLLVDRVLEYWRRGELLETVDARLGEGYDADQARMVLTLGLVCSHPFPGERPAMRQVVQCLDGDAPLPELTPADLSLLSLMQNEGLFDRSALRRLWSSENSVGTMSIDILEGR